MYKTVIGIDPGKSNGGISVLIGNNVANYHVPATFKEMVVLFREIVEKTEDQVAFLEVVNMFGVDTKQPGRLMRMMALFSNYRDLQNALTICNIDIVPVYPNSWQSYMNLRSAKNEDSAVRKKRYKSAAQNMFPRTKVTLWNADALILVKFGVKKLANDREWINKYLIINQNL